MEIYKFLEEVNKMPKDIKKDSYTANTVPSKKVAHIKIPNIKQGILSNVHSKVEAILFLENMPISLKELSKKTELSIENIQQIIHDLNECYETHKHSFFILENSDTYLLAITKAYSKELASLYKVKNTQKLSKSLLETLSIIAYSQPITRSEIETLRGVNSDSAIKLLLNQNLVTILGKKAIPGSPNQYGTTGMFLKTFGLKSIKNLPKLSEGYLKKFEQTIHNK